jgi:hypothetical protein
MTERLKQLLHGEVDGLDVPPPATHDVLRQGRGIRRRRTLVAGATGLAAAVVVGGSVAALSGDTGGGRESAPDPSAAPVEGAVFAALDTVYFDDGARSVRIADKAVKSMYYTSAGVLVRQGDNAYSDGGGKQRFSLLHADGRLTPVGVETEETVHTTDPDQPYLAYGRAVDGQLVVFVHDVATDEQVARVEVGPTDDDWFPIAMDGDHVYVQNGHEGGIFDVDWAAGTASESDLESAWDVVDGRTATYVDDHAAVVDVRTGEVLLEADGPGYFRLSPDGRHAELINEDEEIEAEMGGKGAELEVFDVSDGSSITVAGPSWDWAWSADGGLFSLTEDGTLTTCDPDTGDCSERTVELPPAPPQECHMESGMVTGENGEQVGTEKMRVCEGGGLDLILGNAVRES